MTTYDMKIGTDTQAYASATFDFSANSQENPKNITISLASQRQIKELPFQQVHFYIDTKGIKPRTIRFDGTMQGTNRITALRALSKIIHETGFKRFWLNSDFFVYCTGGSLINTRPFTMNNFIRYSGTMICPIPFVYGGTARTEDWTNTTDGSWVDMTSANDNGSDVGAFTNAGNAPCHIQKWTITNNSDGNITEVRIADATAGGGNKITWTGTLANGGKELIIYLFKVVTGTPDTLKKLYYTNDGTLAGTRDFDGTDAPQIAASTTNQTFSAYIDYASTVGSGSLIKADWYDSYWE